MRKIHLSMILTLAVLMVMSLAISVSAESYKAEGHCYFNEAGNDIVCDFDADTLVKNMSELEPGDDFTFRVEFSSRYKDKTHWYMRNEVLKTLEEEYDRANNGGYTYRLTHIPPADSGKRKQVLFSNEEVGGEYKMPADDPTDGEGLHQATNATEEWFYIEDLTKGQKAYTELYVKFDGESEVNDYMDTAGKLMVAYAVEKDTVKPGRKVKTGDDTDLLTPVLTMIAALLLLILTFISFRKDRKNAAKAEMADGAASSSDTSLNGKERE